ncbi:3-carboxy-cis,cis-muconate cycloisomerase [Ancylobacter polymorphus]|uniref:3-carboxy-cis,cis-muconate cycloisomerase n=1 Tax=Ancylobacter polymorphus TaxID=223390 RepID=A0ABU0BHR5_9HYPH|nr:3-carboxy-cis,cis-muconate cycloisomerase [Ancylobacter polymorphus]MDQ0304975.1 3-carboxy-cis,cis-muconate cycloisomerase [Ancylobacter polymorphus]
MQPRRPLLSALAGDDEMEALFSDDADLSAMLRTESALAAAEAEAGLISPAAAAAIAAGCEAFAPDWERLAAGIARDGVVIPEFVRQLRAAVDAEHAGAVHLGATSQDIIDTSLVCRLKQAVELLDGRLARLTDLLWQLRAVDGALPAMAHTRMQQALPFTAGDRIDTWLRPLRRHHDRLAELLSRLVVVQFGGPIGTRDGLSGQGEAVAAGLAARLGLEPAPCWHSARDGLVEFAAWLALVSGTLGKIGQDIALLAQNEVAGVSLAGGGSSSAMQHKVNPVGAEVLVALARFNAGLAGTLQQAMVHENERSGAAWTLEWLVLPQMAVTTAAALRIALSLLGGLRMKSVV